MRKYFAVLTINYQNRSAAVRARNAAISTVSRAKVIVEIEHELNQVRQLLLESSASSDHHSRLLNLYKILEKEKEKKKKELNL